MVSLKSFKPLNEAGPCGDDQSELGARTFQQQYLSRRQPDGQHNQAIQDMVQVSMLADPNNLAAGSSTPSPVSSSSSSSISIVVVKHDASFDSPTHSANSSIDEGFGRDEPTGSQGGADNLQQLKQSNPIESSQLKHRAVGGAANLLAGSIGRPVKAAGGDLVMFTKGGAVLNAGGRGKRPDLINSKFSVNSESDHFEIVWSNLSYKIEPKWYKRFNFVEQAFAYFVPANTVDSHSSANSTASSSANMDDNQHQMHMSGGAANLAGQTGPATKLKPSGQPIEIFSDLNGTIKSGQMTAVLGPSGAGKTTLLNCLTGKLRNGVSGYINLKGANGKHLKMCTIPQKDHMLEQLTVEENLWFASKIKNPEHGFDHAKNIERVIDLLGLKRCRSAKIKKISGGQHKRVSIAQELLSNPDILVLDEPTSGLDSLTCFKTVSMLRDLVELSANNDYMKPMAIIVTIHQPQPKVFNLFHHVYILGNGGRVVYEGSPDRSLETITRVTGLRPIDGTTKSTCNASASSVDPASFLIEIASEEYGEAVINTLNEYQRQVFYETTSQCDIDPCGSSVGTNLSAAQFQFNQNNNNNNHVVADGDLNLGAKLNHGFAQDFEDGSTKSDEDLSNVFVPAAGEGGGVGANIKVGKQFSATSCESSAIEISNEAALGTKGGGRKGSTKSSPAPSKKRKTRTGSVKSGISYSSSSNQSANSSHTGNGIGQANSTSDPNLYMSEQLLYARVPNHEGRFWSHTATLTHRTLLTIRRDPLLMTSRVLFHLMIPILMGHVYGKATGAANACPHYEPEIDITQIPSLVEGKRIEFMLEELHMSIENVSMFFIIMYAFAAAVLALNALSFPMNMQVLLKETRNGWYSMSSYVLGKTLADLPLELTMPCLTMLLVYPLTGQPSSYLQWRMLTICLIMTLCSLIAQTQALILGALVMNSVQTAVFVSQASQLPWVILAGFTIRIKRLSEPLKLISLTSFYRLGCEAITLTRYGFGICPCDPQEITGEPVRLVGIPDQLRTVAQYWIDSVEASKAALNDSVGLNSEDLEDSLVATTTTTTTTTTLAPSVVGNSGHKNDIFQHLANQLSYANSYGVNITSCDDVAPDRIRAIGLGDSWLVARIWHLLFMLIIMKVLLYYAVKFSIRIRL